MKFCIVGAGIFGSTLARLIAEGLHAEVLLLDAREHVGGNCASYRDEITGIECHRHGSHIFHTSNAEVWNFLNRFTTFTNYQHKVFTRHAGAVYAMPINLLTINHFYGRDFTPNEAAAFLEQEKARDAVAEPANLEEKAVSLIGRPLYDAFIRDYTRKQWGKEPTAIAADVITRLPVRMNYNNNYFNDTWQGLPREGYHALFVNLLDHPNITLRLATPFATVRGNLDKDCIIIYTGMLDALLEYKHGVLEWRSLRFEWETVPVQDYQGTSVMNYADRDVPYTRIHEFKHYHPERTKPFAYPASVICREYPHTFSRGDEAYYPVDNERNRLLYQRYLDEITASEPNLLVGGRLGAYRYWDMDKAVAHALDLFKTRLAGLPN